MYIRGKTAVWLVALVGLWFAGAIHARDWPQWRGANRDGRSAPLTVPQAWPETLTRGWTTHIGLGDATPALVGDKLYTFGRQDVNEVVLCLHAADGSTVWNDTYLAGFLVTGPAKDHGGPRSSVAVAAGKVCTLGVGGILSCLEAETGKVLWRKQSAADYDGVAYKFDTSMSPLVTKDLCIVHIGGEGKGAIMAFDLATGDCQWKCEGHGPACSSPVLMAVDGIKQLVTLTDKNALGLALSNGRLLWQMPFEAERGNNTTPVVHDHAILLTGLGKGIVALEVTAADKAYTADEAWHNDSAPVMSRFTTPVWKGGRLYGYGRRLYCLNAETHEILWEGTESLGNSAAIVDAGQVMVALGVKGDLVIYDPDTPQYQELARYKLADTDTWAHPIIAGSRIYIRDKEAVTLWTIE